MDAGDTEEIKLTGLGSKLDPSGQKLFLCFSVFLTAPAMVF